MSSFTAEAGEPSHGQLPGREKQEEPVIKLPTFLAIALANRMRETNRTAAESLADTQATRPRRDIGPIGTVARVILGSILFGSVFYGHIMKGPLAVTVGHWADHFSGHVLTWQYLRARRNPAKLEAMVIVRNIWQKLSSVEHDVALIVTNFWLLLSEIFSEILLIVRNIWRNPTLDQSFKKTSRLYRLISPTDEIYNAKPLTCFRRGGSTQR
jgi:hypothetical protein